jgi:predicted DNA-binding transcriptional regulator AlpA
MGRSNRRMGALDLARSGQALKVSRSWIYAKAESGELPSLRIGGMLRFDPGAIRRFALAPRAGVRLLPLVADSQAES